MRKHLLKFLLIASLTFMGIKSQAQNVQGKNIVNAGIGLGSFGFTGTGGLPIVASIEHGFTPTVSAGVNFAYAQTKYDFDLKYSYLIAGLRGSYHFNELFRIENNKLDLYGGAGLLYRHYKAKYIGSGKYDQMLSSGGGDLDFSLHAGIRYMFANSVGAYAEAGYGISPLQLGISFHF